MATRKNTNSIEVDDRLYALLQRCATIEERPMEEIVTSCLAPHLDKYQYDSLEEWEDARDLQDMQRLTFEFETAENFDPDKIPFNTQILGLRRKIDELEKQILQNPAEREDLEKEKFNILKELNFAEQEALHRQQEEHQSKIQTWKDACEKIPL